MARYKAASASATRDAADVSSEGMQDATPRRIVTTGPTDAAGCVITSAAHAALGQGQARRVVRTRNQDHELLPA
jgi:hypothetical protein